ncbi:unnamed protein product [Darwinula stevensoni]|uniref:Uncharacterized protein n=1 Tax=Darwinula stevensoni TaxID=69355 RepID=A0A7R9A965_9CRUS|nr:unnamed protein product [Darwinula stevensoni]CAG0897003.1 unnamed protein product [Darwinula stevensoni]
MTQASGSSVRIGTHDGIVHCDDALACFMLKLLPEYQDATIIRSRDEDVLSECNVVVDVGGVYDPAKLRFDHHQNDFEESMSTVRPGKKWRTKLSSAGLVFNHFGHRIISRILNWPIEDSDFEESMSTVRPGKKWRTKLSSAGLVFNHFGHRIISRILNWPIEDSRVDVVFDVVYENLFEEIDAIDNGVAICDHRYRKYKSTTNLPCRVSNLRPPWTDRVTRMDVVFHKAMQMAGDELLDRIRYYGDPWWLARSLFIEDAKRRFQVHKSGKILELSESYPWKEHFSHSEDVGILPKSEVAFIICKENSGDWNIRPVQSSSGFRHVQINTSF